MFIEPIADPRRGILWAGAAPVDRGTVRVGVGLGGGWFAAWQGSAPELELAGGGVELDAAWAPHRRVALAVTAGVGAAPFGAWGPAEGVGGVVSARWLVLDGPSARVAPFVAGGYGVGSASDVGLGVVGAGLAVEVPLYGVVFDLALPLGGFVVSGSLPDEVPLALGPFAPLFLLGECGFTWRLGEHTSFRLGYLAAAPSWSWRWRGRAATVEVSGHTNVVSGNLSVRVGWAPRAAWR